MTISEDSLLDALAEALQAGLKEVAIYARDHHWSLRNSQVVMHRVWSDGTPSVWYQDDMVVDYGAIGRCVELLKETSSDSLAQILGPNERLAAAFATSDFGSDVNPTIRIAAAVDALIADFAVLYFRDSESFDWNESAFAEAIDAVRDFARSNSHSLVVRSPLLGFSMNANELKIAEGIQVELLEQEELQRLESSNLYERQAQTITPFQWTPGRYVIEMKVEVAIGADRYEERQAIVLRLHECLTAIRLASEGVVYLGDIWFERVSPHFGDSFDDVYVADGLLPRINPGIQFLVDENTSATIAELFAGLAGVWALGAKKSNPLFIPNSRFNMYFDRTLVEDQLLDLAICLEALFTKSGESSEVTDKISRRVGRLLGSSQEERLEVVSKAKRLYQLRSSLVHGEQVEAQVLFDNVHVLLGMIRQAIVLKIRTGWTVESIENEMMA